MFSIYFIEPYFQQMRLKVLLATNKIIFDRIAREKDCQKREKIMGAYLKAAQELVKR